MLKRSAPRVPECEPTLPTKRDENKVTPRKSPVVVRPRRKMPEALELETKLEMDADGGPKTKAEDEVKGGLDGEQKKIVPVLHGEEDCARLIAEGECNPRAWSLEDVKTFMEINDLPEPARKLKLSGESLLKLNKESVAVKVQLKTTLVLMKLIFMLRRIEQAYTKKHNPPSPPQLFSPPSFLSNFKIPKRKFDEQDLTPEQDRESKHLRFSEFSPQTTPKYPSPDVRRGAKICYKCKGGHLAHECTHDPSGSQLVPTAAAASSEVDEWGDAVPPAKSVVEALAVALAGTQPPSLPQELEEWGDPVVAAAPTPATPYAYGNRGGMASGRGGFDRGGRGRGSGGYSSGPRVCFRCHEEGHMSRECPQGQGIGNRGGGRGGGNRICYKCKEEGHLGRDCTKSGYVRPSMEVQKSCTATPASGVDEWVDPPPATKPPPLQQTDDEGWGSVTIGSTPAPPPPTSISWNKNGNWGGRECPQGQGIGNRGGGRGGGNRICYKCKEEGHLSRDCTKSGHVRPSMEVQKSSTTTPASVVDEWDDPPPPTKPPPLQQTDDEDWGSVSIGSTPAPPPPTSISWNKNGNWGGRAGFDRGGRGGSGGQGAPRTCFRCNEEGHISRDCPRNARGGGSRSGGSGPPLRRCYTCHEEGHGSWACPNGGNNNRAGGGSGSARRFQSQPQQQQAQPIPNAQAANDDDW